MFVFVSMKRTGPMNDVLKELIASLKKQKTPLWKRVAKDLSRATRQRRAVNLSRITTNLQDGETALVPGKVLGSGDAGKYKVAAWQFSDMAAEQIKKAGGTVMSIPELMKANPKGQKVRIIG